MVHMSSEGHKAHGEGMSWKALYFGVLRIHVSVWRNWHLLGDVGSPPLVRDNFTPAQLCHLQASRERWLCLIRRSIFRVVSVLHSGSLVPWVPSRLVLVSSPSDIPVLLVFCCQRRRALGGTDHCMAGIVLCYNPA